MEHTSTTPASDPHAVDPHVAHHVDKHVRMYLMVGLALGVLTLVTVGLSYVNFGSSQGNIVVALIVATIKAGLVAAIFMHLGSEKWTIYRFLIITVFFVCGLFLLTGLAFHDPIRVDPGEYTKANQIKADQAALAAEDQSQAPATK